MPCWHKSMDRKITQKEEDWQSINQQINKQQDTTLMPRLMKMIAMLTQKHG